jgi:hypothetical protein
MLPTSSRVSPSSGGHFCFLTTRWRSGCISISIETLAWLNGSRTQLQFSSKLVWPRALQLAMQAGKRHVVSQFGGALWEQCRLYAGQEKEPATVVLCGIESHPLVWMLQTTRLHCRGLNLLQRYQYALVFVLHTAKAASLWLEVLLKQACCLYSGDSSNYFEYAISNENQCVPCTVCSWSSFSEWKHPSLPLASVESRIANATSRSAMSPTKPLAEPFSHGSVWHSKSMTLVPWSDLGYRQYIDSDYLFRPT